MEESDHKDAGLVRAVCDRVVGMAAARCFCGVPGFRVPAFPGVECGVLNGRSGVTQASDGGFPVFATIFTYI